MADHDGCGLSRHRPVHGRTRGFADVQTPPRQHFLDRAAVHYYHPAGSCKMGPASDPDSVVDSEGRAHGIEGLHVADASLMPAVISGNTNIPTTVIGERIARSLLGLAPSYVRVSHQKGL
jgi:choline dehydrogenase-like flavoprotein